MRIGLFTNYFPPSVGGLENSVLGLYNGLKKSGHEVFVFAPKYSGPDEEDKKNIFRYRSLRFKYRGYPYAITMPFASKIDLFFIKKLNLDIIHSQQPFLLGNEALKFSKALNIPLVFTYHTRYEDYMHFIPVFSKIIPKTYIVNYAIAYANQCDAVIAPSSAIKKFILSHGIKPPISVIPSGINIELFSSDKGERIKMREKYKIGNNEVVLVTAGRLSEEKNVRFLIDCFSEIFKKNKKVKFFIIGDGILKNNFEQMSENLGLKKNIIFAGWVSKEDVANYYKASDIFIFASKTETQGLVVAEAMAAGLPIIAINASGTEDAVIDGENGFLIGNSKNDFSEKVLEIINNIELRKKMSICAKESSKKFSQELWIRKIINLYESLI